MLLAEDDFPLHQSPEPLAHAMSGHPNAYDRFWFNGYTENLYFAVAMGLYPNRGVIDAAFSVVQNGQQRSVFCGDLLVGRPTSVGAIEIQIIEPLRVNRVVVSAPEQGLAADLTYTARFQAVEEPRLIIKDGPGIFLDYSRASQLGTWHGWIETPQGRVEIDSSVRGTKDRSWGVRPVGEPLPGAPRPRAPQICFFWAPLHFENDGVHFFSNEDSDGSAWQRTGVHFDSDGSAPREALHSNISLVGERGTRWPLAATLHLDDEEIELTPLLRFHMRGVGYSHPTYGHGKFHGGPYQDGEVLVTNELAPLDFANIHIQQVVAASRGNERGIGVLESFIVGPHEPSGLTGLLDGF